MAQILSFGFDWSHQPYPIKPKIGQQAFAMPLGAFIHNLDVNIANVAGAGTAAARNIGTNTGQVMEVTERGLGGIGYGISSWGFANQSADWSKVPRAAGWFKVADGSAAATGIPNRNAPYGNYGIYIARQAANYGAALFFPYGSGSKAFTLRITPQNLDYSIYHSGDPIIYDTADASTSGKLVTVLSTGEMCSKGFTVDANGVFKAASPVVRLFAEKLELNDEAQEQEIKYERIDIGDYLVKGSLGFAQEGWYIELPKDANGNVLFAVVYNQLENNDISVKTYKKKFDIETASIVADLKNPVDITEGRWIDLRLQELPIPEIEEDPEELSLAPADFQPTNLAQAVAEYMEIDAPSVLTEQEPAE